MKKLFLVLIMLLFSLSANAANIISYNRKVPGKVIFHFISSKHIFTIKYDERKKLLMVYVNEGERFIRNEFRVNTYEEAQSIIKRLFDDNDSSLIELVRF